MSKEIYCQLQQHLDNIPFLFPEIASAVEIRDKNYKPSRITLILLAILIQISCNIKVNAQTTMNDSLHYIHENPASFDSFILRSLLVVTGKKNSLERKMKHNKFSHGAPPLPSSLKRKAIIEESSVLNHGVWTLYSKDTAPDLIILYVHGGAYVSNLTSFHWKFIEKLLESTSAKIVLPDYPLAPGASYKEVYEMIGKVYELLLEASPSSKIILMGDSAGAGFSLGFAQKLRDEKKPQPADIVLLSPWLDITMTNPGIEEIDKNDKLLGITGLKMAGNAYAAELDPSNFLVSPIYGDLQGLSTISIFIGTHDILYPDAQKLYEKLANNGSSANFYEYPKMAHDWMIFTWMPEAKHALEQVREILAP